MAEEQATGGLLDRLRNSPRTVSTIIVILIIAGAIFAFSDRGQTPSPSPTSVTGEEQSPIGSPEVVEEGEGEVTGAPKPTAVAGTATPQASPLPSPSETAEAYTEVAERGNGVTHLARRATARYLTANPADFTVSNEHRVFIEDYLKDRIGRQRLAAGGQVTISKELIREAVDASKKLSDAQLQNLQKYSQRVQWE